MKNYFFLFSSIFFLSPCFAENTKPQASPSANPTVEIPQIEENYRYDPTNKRDPFKPFNFSATPVPKDGAAAVTSYSLGQLRLTAIVDSPTGERKAIVEDNQGRGYTLTIGSLVGKEGGQVTSIEPDKVIIEINSIDFTGKEHKSTQEMKIQLSAPSGQIKSQVKDKKKK